MFTRFFLLTFSLLTLGHSYAQVSINNASTPPHASAMLDVQSPNKGLLVPRMGTTSRMSIPSPANGLMVFDTDASAFYFYDSVAVLWKAIGSGGAPGNAWLLSGNNSVNSASDFLGTINKADLVFKTNSQRRMTIDSNGFIGIRDIPLANNLLYISRASNDTGAGHSGLFVLRNGGPAIASAGGVDWTSTGVDAAIKGTSEWGNRFSAGVAGYNYADFPGAQSAAVIGLVQGNDIFGAAGFYDGSRIWGLYSSGNAYVAGSLTIPTGAGQGSLLTSDASGNASWQKPAAASVAFSSGITGNQVIANNTATRIEYNSADFIDGAGFNVATNRFTATIAGTYIFNASAEWLPFGSPTGNIEIEIRKNDVAVKRVFLPASTNINSTQISEMLKLAPGDFVTVYAAQNSGSNQQIVAGPGTKLYGYRLY